jgi:hypothetical protein
MYSMAQLDRDEDRRTRVANQSVLCPSPRPLHTKCGRTIEQRQFQDLELGGGQAFPPGADGATQAFIGVPKTGRGWRFLAAADVFVGQLEAQWHSGSTKGNILNCRFMQTKTSRSKKARLGSRAKVPRCTGVKIYAAYEPGVDLIYPRLRSRAGREYGPAKCRRMSWCELGHRR